MPSIADGFAGKIASSMGGFTQRILGQASHIDRLQQGGAGAASGPAPAGSPTLAKGASLESVVARVATDPQFAEQVMGALERHPPLLAKAARTMAMRPDLAAKLPVGIQSRLGLRGR